MSLSSAARAPRPRAARWILIAVAIAAMALLVTACGSSGGSSGGGGGGSSSSSSSSGGGGGSTAKGSPLTVYTFTDVVTQGPQYKNIEESARVAAAYLNAHGGVAGHQLNEKFCDTKGSPTQAAACARQAVQDKAVAVLGSFNFTGTAEIPILEAANIPWFGVCCPVAPPEFTSKISFPMGNQPLYAVGLVKRAVQDGCKKIGGVIIEGAETFKPLMDNAAKGLGTKIVKYVSLPATARDYSPQVAQATSGTDCLVMIVSETPFIAWNNAYQQSGAKQRMYGPEGNLDPKSAKGFPITDGSVIASFGYTDWSLPAWKDYRAALKQYNADPNQDYDSPGGKGTWMSYLAFAQVAKNIKGTIDNNSFLAAANTAKISFPGQIPDLDFSKPWIARGGPKGYDRLFNLTVSFDKLQNGKLVPVTTKLEDVSALAEGKPQK